MNSNITQENDADTVTPSPHRFLTGLATGTNFSSQIFSTHRISLSSSSSVCYPGLATRITRFQAINYLSLIFHIAFVFVVNIVHIYLLYCDYVLLVLLLLVLHLFLHNRYLLHVDILGGISTLLLLYLIMDIVNLLFFHQTIHHQYILFLPTVYIGHKLHHV